MVLLSLCLPPLGWAQTGAAPAGGWQGQGGEWAGKPGTSPQPGRYRGNRYVPPAGQPVYRPLEEDEEEGGATPSSGGTSPSAYSSPRGGDRFVPPGYGEGTPPGPLPDDLSVPLPPGASEGSGSGRWDGGSTPRNASDPSSPGGRWTGRSGTGSYSVPRWGESAGSARSGYPPPSSSSATRRGEWPAGEPGYAAPARGEDYSSSGVRSPGRGAEQAPYEAWSPPPPAGGGYYPPHSPATPHPGQAPVTGGWSPQLWPGGSGYRFPGGWFGLPGGGWSPPWEGGGWNVPQWGGGGYPPAASYPYGYERGYYGHDQGYAPREYAPGYGYGQVGRW